MAEVLCVGDTLCLALAKHRLTAVNVRKMFATDRELFALMQNADLQRRMGELAKSMDPQRQLPALTVDAQVYDRIPEIAQVLRRHQISSREYAVTHAVAMVTAMTDVSLAHEAQHGGRKEVPPALMTQGLKFWRSMDSTFKAEAEAWKKMWGYDRDISR